MDSGASPVSCKWVKPQGPPKGFDFDVTKAEQIFDLLLKEKQLKWDGDEVEVVHADDSEISTAGMDVWETSGQEPLSGINLDDCERIDVTKNGVRLVLSTGLTV
ncbi:hypothetical protein QYE76_036600 [Lolium multiflorum]|uniref:Uncharacterized protein n=1 Tax=Lolium multiflorum TaxID=4521 RepID=A0AAD8R338_LOLMU|nr:hypothetical protein QYE76_036600 [Lolium multiflorum]